MKNQLKSLISLVLLFSFFACEKENIDTNPPQQIDQLTATAKNQAVLLEWINPGDEDFNKTVLTINSTSIDIAKEYNSILIQQLENGVEYTFDLSTVDISGNISVATSVKATPDKYVTKFEGRDFESGNYKSSSQFTIDININGDNYKRIMTAGSNQYIWEGTISKSNDTTTLFNLEYYTDNYLGVTHVAFLEEKMNGVFCFNHVDTTFYCSNGLEKVEGSSNFITGKYRQYIRTISSDVASYSDTTLYYAEFKENGEVIYSTNDGNTETTSWTNEDLLSGKFLFVNLNSTLFLVDKNRFLLYKKQ